MRSSFQKFKNLMQLVAVLSLFLGASCNKETPPPTPSGPKTQELVRRVPEKEPDWVFGVNEKDGDKDLYFVGISKKFREERDARSDARTDAGNQFVQYCGVEARVFNEYISQSMGLSSEVIDSTESVRESSKMRSEAYFSRLKVKETSTEIYREMQSGTELGRFYKIKVLARIPKTEYERVQEWKKEQGDKREKTAKKVLDEKLKNIELLSERGLVLKALDEVRSLIEKAKEEETRDWEIYLTKAEKIRSGMLGGLKLMPVSEPTISMRPLQDTPPLKVRVVILKKGKDFQVVPNFPLVFKRGDQSEEKITGKDGSSVLKISPPESEGRFVITAVPDLSRLDKSFPKDALQAIKSQKVDFTIEVRADYIKGIAKSEYQFGLKGLSDGEELKVGDQFGLTLSCSRRCRARVYYWDGSEAKLIKKFEKVRFGKRKTVSTPPITTEKEGVYKIIAISTSDKFNDDPKEGTPYDSMEFGMLLKNFRSSSKPIAETHLNLTVIK